MTPAPMFLVTGAGGPIGRRLRARLDAAGVPAAYLLSPRSSGRSDDAAVDICDVTDRAGLERVVATRRPAAVIHLASVTGALCDEDPARAAAVNVDAVRSLVAIAQDHGVARVVLASTSAVYGDQYAAPIPETGDLVLASRYAQTKREAEIVLEAAVSAPPRLSAAALRIFNVYGPGMASSLANRLVAAGAESPVVLSGLDSFVRDYVHVDDVVDALLRAAEAPLPRPWSVLNIGSGVPTSNRRLVAALGRVHFAMGEERASYSCADITVARRELDFSPHRALTRATAA